MTNNKPREFWLDICSPYGDPCDFISEGSPHISPSATNIHVIEYSTYQLALEEIEKLKKSYEFSSSSVVAAVKEIERLQQENEFLKEQVKQGTIDYLELEAKVAKLDGALRLCYDRMKYTAWTEEECFEVARQALAESNLPPDDNNCIQCEDL